MGLIHQTKGEPRKMFITARGATPPAKMAWLRAETCSAAAA
jgi:hypothetical protein